MTIAEVREELKKDPCYCTAGPCKHDQLIATLPPEQRFIISLERLCEALADHRRDSTAG